MLKKLTMLPWILGGAALMLGMAPRQDPAPPPPPPGKGPSNPPFNLVPPLGIPLPPLRPDNPLTVNGVALGQRLFFENRLSGNNTQSCASCHRPNVAFNDVGKAVSVGIKGIAGTRNTPSILNSGFLPHLFWDGRAPSLRAQALVPIQNPIEMDSTLTEVISKLSADPTYQSQFQNAFGTPGITPERIGLALEQFEITQLSGNSKFDAAQAGKAVLTAQEQRGADLFRTPYNPPQGLFGADCIRCHGGPIFTDARFHNNGLDTTFKDLGLGAIDGNPADDGKFKTPSLRNIAATGPYMHDGRFTTLAEVVAHYSDGIVPSPTLDPGLARENGGVHLSAADQAALVAFLETLTDPRYAPSRP